MTAKPHSIDLSAFVAEHLERVEPDVLRSMLSSFIQALMSAEADALCGAPYGTRSANRTNSRNGYRSRDFDTRAGTVQMAIPKLREGFLLPGLAAGTAETSRTGAGFGGGDQLSSRRLHAADGEAGRNSWHHPAQQIPGECDGTAAGRAGRRLPVPAAGPGPVHVPRRGRVDDEGPRGWPGGAGARTDRDRGQRRRAPRGPRCRCHLRRRRRRLAEVLPGPEASAVCLVCRW
jgi:putative transposase